MPVDIKGDVQVFHIDPAEPVRANRVVNWLFYDNLVAALTRHGWDGPPLVVLTRDHCEPPLPPLAVTGSHRLAAAEKARVEVPCVELADLYQTRGLNLDELLDEWIPEGHSYSDFAVYQAISRVLDRLPIWMVRHYDITWDGCRGTAPAGDGHQHLCNMEPEHLLDDIYLHRCEVCDVPYEAVSY
jgi:hypothetical protein